MGWTDPESGKEYALVGMFDGTSIVDISNPKRPIVLGFINTSGDLPPGDFSGFFRDIKIVNDVAYIGAEVSEHGIQVFDLKRLRDLEGRDIFDGNNGKKVGQVLLGGDVPRIKPDLVIEGIGSSHNMVQFPEINKVMAVGFAADATDCDIGAGESVAVYDVSNPLEPQLEACLSGDYNPCVDPDDNCSYADYVHDGQCFMYDGPDIDYTGKPICVFFAETEVVLFDMETYEPFNVFMWADYAYGK